MHFSIPDTQEFHDESGSPYMAFNVHVNGVFHCAVRFKQLHNFHEQLKREFGNNVLPPFPPKKLLSLTPVQLEERRFLLERYIQLISQEQDISNSAVFNSFLLNAQQETQQQEPEDVSLEIFLMNGHKITVNIQSTDQTDLVLEKVASQIEVPEEFVYYFGLFLIRKETDGDNSIVRRLQDFESPYISLNAAMKDGLHRIVLRKSTWDLQYDDHLLEDRISMNLLYVQAVNDVERGWVQPSKDQLKRLNALQEKGSKKEYLHFCRTLKYYGYIQFKTCTTDYPHPDCRVVVSAGNRELNFRVEVGSQFKEGSFKVTRMRCWRITTTYAEANGDTDDNMEQGKDGKLELAFEYLIAKDTLKWVRIISDQAILMSMCLQGMVDELVLKKQGKKIRRPAVRKKEQSHNFIKRDSSTNFLKQISSGGGGDRKHAHKKIVEKKVVVVRTATDDSPSAAQNAAQKAKHSVKRIQDKITTAVKSPLRSSENDAYDGGVGDYGIGDDDL
ncbi:sorting nexin-17-like isoform X2 [Lineus longissimus]|uniref:sorting nexin-17-like isoform X2 n=1 Tax=Lineus longissimus TaxID=88925 RepID=UPI00315C7330